MQEKLNAVESYNMSEKRYNWHEIGSLDEMLDFVKGALRSSAESESIDMYYRIIVVDEHDLMIWNKQAELLPDIPKTERLFGEWVDIDTAAKYLGVTFGRVFNLATDGLLRTQVSGKNKLVSVEDVVNRKIANPRSGRPALRN